MSSPQVTCDGCSKEFELKLGKQRLPNQVDRHFFACPDCGEEYTTHYTDHDIRSEQQKVQYLWGKFNKAKGNKKREEIHADIKIRQKHIGELMDALKNNLMR